MGADSEQSRRCAPSARGAGERDRAARRVGRGLSRVAEGKDAGAGSARLGDDAENLGNALFALGERQSGTTRFDEAVAAFPEALKEWTRERVPLDWATVQNNLANALSMLGERESGTAL